MQMNLDQEPHTYLPSPLSDLITAAIMLVVIYIQMELCIRNDFSVFIHVNQSLPFLNQLCMIHHYVSPLLTVVCAVIGCCRTLHMSGPTLSTCNASGCTTAKCHDFDLAHRATLQNLDALLLCGLQLWHVAYVCSGLNQQQMRHEKTECEYPFKRNQPFQFQLILLYDFFLVQSFFFCSIILFIQHAVNFTQ